MAFTPAFDGLCPAMTSWTLAIPSTPHSPFTPNPTLRALALARSLPSPCLDALDHLRVVHAADSVLCHRGAGAGRCDAARDGQRRQSSGARSAASASGKTPRTRAANLELPHRDGARRSPQIGR